MLPVNSLIKPLPGLSFLSEENGKPCHKHILNGEEVPGCTSVSGLFQEDGWKFAWGPKLMYDTLLKLVETGQPIGEGDLFRAKSAWRRKRDKAADTGTIAHEIIAQHITMDNLLVHSQRDVFHTLTRFSLWQEQYSPEWLACEVQVGSARYKFAGILDALVNIDGKLTLLDFKTSSAIKDDYAIQLAGLCIALEEMGVTVEQRAILHLPKVEGENYEFRIIDSDLTKDKLAFLVGLEFYRHKNLFLARCKSDKRSAVASNRG